MARETRPGAFDIPDSTGGSAVSCTMVAPLLAALRGGDRKLAKSIDVAVKYGYRGYSRGGRNGVFLQRAQDRRMTEETYRLAERFRTEVLAWLGESEWDAARLRTQTRPVKVVHHDPSGRRVVGLMREGRILFVGIASYR